MKTKFYKLLLLISIVIGGQQLMAHTPDQSYLYLRIYKSAIEGRIEMNAKDMNTAFGLNLEEALSMEVVEPHLQLIQNYLKQRAQISANGKVFPIRFTETTILNLGEEVDFARFHFALDGVDEVPDAIDIDYNVLFDRDSKHRGLLIVEYNWKAGIVNNEAMMSDMFSPDNKTSKLSLTDASVWKGFVTLVKLGVWHIWIGLDHILFIVALILPAVVRRKETNDAPDEYSSIWTPVEKFKPALWYIIKIITFFTIAHSITLALAALNVINLSSRLVESIIAISIALAAIHNIRPLILDKKEWLIALIFGLFHGFGFASVLGDKGLGGDYLVPSLLGFNIGVEIGQVLIICALFPILFFIRKLKLYPGIIKYGSMVLIFISLYWFVERAFDVDLPLGAWIWKLLG